MVLVHVCVKRKREHHAKAETGAGKDIRQNSTEDDSLACAWCYISQKKLCSWCSGERTDDEGAAATIYSRNVSDADSTSSRKISSPDDGMVQGKHSFSPRAGIYAICPPTSSYKGKEPTGPGFGTAVPNNVSDARELVSGREK